MKQEVYVKGRESSLINTSGQFVYEVCVFVTYDNFYHLANHTYYYTDKEITNFVKTKKVSKYIEIQCSLFSAPIEWLRENEFVLYKKPEKKSKKNEQSIM